MPNQNFTIKVSLDEANVIKKALILYRDNLMEEIDKNGGVQNMPASGHEAGITETLIRRDFS